MFFSKSTDNIVPSKIIMLGGRRTGKSTILSTLIHSLNEKASHLCSFSDLTPYGASSGMQIPLRAKRLEIDNYLRTRQKYGNNSQFIVDMSPNVGEGVFNLEASVKGASRIKLDFVDVPGEWMEETHGQYSAMKEHVKESDVFIIAIDTPYLMQDENPNINTVWNRTEEITNLMAQMQIGDDKLDRKQIIFVPVKCEKWAAEHKLDQVTERVKQAYRTLINTWIENEAVEIWIMPIETAGGLEHTRLLDAYRCYRTDKDKTGEICSIDPLTGILHLKDGKTLFENSVDSVDPAPDKSYMLSYTQIPLSWYRATGNGFKPKNCEQVAFHLLNFLVKKEEATANLRYEEYCNKVWWKRIFSSGSRFGKYLPVYRDLINKIPLKLQGDGFCKIDGQIPSAD